MPKMLLLSLLIDLDALALLKQAAALEKWITGSNDKWALSSSTCFHDSGTPESSDIIQHNMNRRDYYAE